MKKVRIRYFAQLKEIAGTDEEYLELESAASAATAFETAAARHSFPHSLADLRVAINDEFAGYEQILRDGDTVVFIPPVSGG